MVAVVFDSALGNVRELADFTLDLAFGSDENAFTLTCAEECAPKEGQYVFIDGTEYGDGHCRSHQTLYCLPCHGWHLNVGNVIAHVETVADSLDRGYSAVLLQQQGGYSHDDDGYERTWYLFAELRSDGNNHHTHNAHKRAP